MSIVDIILTGVSWLLGLGIIISVVFMFLLATWMQVNERTGNHERKAEAQESICPAPAAQRRRRRTAEGYQRAMP